LVVFEIRSCFMSESDCIMILLFVLSHLAGITEMYHYAQPLVKMGWPELFA
jgi:hypothetical protein